MSEETMMALVQQALDGRGIKYEVTAVGEFYPRGHTGGLFARIVIGEDVGEALGGVGKAVGVAVGSLAGMKAADTASRLPSKMLVGVSHGGLRPPIDVAEQGADRPRVPHAAGGTRGEGAQAAERPARADRRVLRPRIELEGNRVPLTHSKDVIAALVH